MDIFRLSYKILGVFVAGVFATHMYLVLHKVPLFDIESDYSFIFFVGLLVVLFSEPIYKLLRPKLYQFAEFLSIALGTVIITGILYIFPIGIQEYKLIQIDTFISNQNIQEIKKKVLQEGKDIFLINKKTHYVVIYKENPSPLPYIPSNLIKETGHYGLLEINFEGGKLLLVRDIEKEEKKLFYFLVSLVGVYGFFSFLALLITRKEKENGNR